jgi:deoxyribonuclease (pyrimidine dimer)
MTRINLVPPEELMDQHLFAEFREIKMVPKSLRRSLQAAARYTGAPAAYVKRKIPPAYTLNTGHVSFFYDKAIYLRKRYALLRAELERRAINFNRDSLLDPDGVFDALDEHFINDYDPTPEALAIVRQRIAEKIALKPAWYRYEGKPNEPNQTSQPD